MVVKTIEGEGIQFWWSSYYMSGSLCSLLLFPIILKISIIISILLLKILTCKVWLISNPMFSLLHHAVSSFPVETYYCGLATLIPCSPFFLQQLSTCWEHSDSDRIELFWTKKFTDNNSRGQSIFVIFCSWYWDLGTVAQIISQWYLIHHL